MRAALVAAALGAVVMAAPGRARAQDFDAAGKQFSAAQDAFKAKHYLSAAVRFQAAYDVTKDPLLLYNIAESWQKGGDGKKALAAYRAYLKAQPEAKDRDEIEKRIKAVEAQLAKRGKLPSQSAPGDDVAATVAQIEKEKAAARTKDATLAPPDLEKPTMTPPAKDAVLAPTQLADNAPAPAPGTAPTTTTTTTTTTTAPATPAPTTTTPAPTATTPPAPTTAPTSATATTATTPPAPAETTPPPAAPAEKPGLLDEAPPSKLRIAAWIGVASTVAVLTAGAILGLSAQSRADEISRRLNFVDSNGQPKTFDMAQQADYKNLRDEGKTYEAVAIAFYALSGALAVTTAVMFGVDYKQQKDKREAARSQARLRIRPTLGGIGGAF
jgi:tetratricopeptide (TPR) repeat protein